MCVNNRTLPSVLTLLRPRTGAVRMTVHLASFLVLFVPSLSLAAAASETNCFLFTYFTGNGEDGLHFASSRDGYKWEPVASGKSFLTPEVGEAKLMRDPCLLRGPDGVFHLVWTTSWQGKTIGYASSKDLIHWSKQSAIPVMKAETNAMNCWAPEIAYSEAKQRYVIFWATTIRGKFPETEGQGDKGYNHRIYQTTTSDFKTFTPSELFFDPGFEVIDATLLRAKGRFYLIFKDERLKPAKKHLQLASSDNIEGPFTNISPPFTADWVEGPSALQVGEDVLVYFDAYREHHYGAVRSRDLEHWEDVSNKTSFPKGMRHGTALAVPCEILENLTSNEKSN